MTERENHYDETVMTVNQDTKWGAMTVKSMSTEPTQKRKEKRQQPNVQPLTSQATLLLPPHL